MSNFNVTPPQPRPVRSRPPIGSPASAAPLLRATSSTARPYNDAIVSELCTLDTFQNDFNTNDFIAQLTSKLVQRSKADPGPFNPRPFIRTFEAAMDQLVQIRAQVDAQSQQISSAVHVAESAYTKKLDELSKNFVAVGNSFNSLEDRISEVGRTAIRIGEQLETIDKQRNRASEAHDLIEFYYMFARGDTSKLERLRKEGGREGRIKTAIIARRLAAISREVDVAGAEQTRDSIDRYCERFERDMLKLFDKFYRRSDPKMMSHIAKVLQGFNGGASCVQIYVNQHDFFISKDRVGEANNIELSQIWTTMADPDHAPPKSEPSLTALFDEIRQTVEIEAQIISAVFPNPFVVMQTFLQRVFAQSVQGFVEVIMDKAVEIHAPSFVGAGGIVDPKTAALELNPPTSTQPTTSHLAFLRALHMARSSALKLVNDLKMYDYRGAGITGPAHTGTNGAASCDGVVPDSLRLLGSDVVAGAAHLAAASASPLASMLDQSVEELFVPYMEGIRYIDRESRSLADLYAGLLSRFITFHRTAAAKKDKGAGNTIFNRMRNQITATSDASSSTSSLGGSSSATHASTAASSTTSTSKTSFFKLSNLADRVRGTHSAGASSNNLAVGTGGALPTSAESSVDGHHVTGGARLEDELEDTDGDLSLEVAEKMLRWHAESIGRCVDLSSPSEVPKATFALLRVLTSAYIKTYVETALDSALVAVSAQDIRGATMPDPSAGMSLVRSVELLISLWQHYVNTALLPLASPSVTSRREMMIFNNHNLLRVEGKCDALMQKIADNVVGFLSNRLATQKKNDFTPKNDDLAFARQNTEPCVACSEALEKVQQAARANLSLSSSRMVNSASGSINVRGSPGPAQRPGSSGAVRGGASMDASDVASARVNWNDADTNADLDVAEDDQHRSSHLSRNAESFLTEIGVAFHGLLLDHLRKYTVSATGGIVLTKDLAMYQDAIGTFGITVLSDRFEMLRQLGNLFIVQASVLKSYMREGHLAKIDERLLRPYLLRRADYAKEVRDLDDGPTAPTTPTAATAGVGNPFATVVGGGVAGGRDLFGHLPGLISGTNGGVAEGGGSSASGAARTAEDVRLQRLGEVLTSLERFSLDAVRGYGKEGQGGNGTTDGGVSHK